MKHFNIFFLASTWLIFASCNQHITTVYFNDNTKVDDGEIFGEELMNFFKAGDYIYTRTINSNALKHELKAISDTLSMLDEDEQLDDGYYGYAFITSAKDTLYADYTLNYWKSNKKRKALSSSKLREIIGPVFENPYLKK